jgi:hypothetical protein
VNQYQLRVLWVTVGAAFIFLVVPPWTGGSGQPLGYYFFWSAPSFRSSIDGTRLLIQLGMVGLVGAAAWVTARDERLVFHMISKVRDKLPDRKELSAFVGYASLLMIVACVGLLLVAWTSPRGITAGLMITLLPILSVALALFALTARHYFDSVRKR